jgi:hypothetical protein
LLENVPYRRMKKKRENKKKREWEICVRVESTYQVQYGIYFFFSGSSSPFRA